MKKEVNEEGKDVFLPRSKFIEERRETRKRRKPQADRDRGDPTLERNVRAETTNKQLT